MKKSKSQSGKRYLQFMQWKFIKNFHKSIFLKNNSVEKSVRDFKRQFTREVIQMVNEIKRSQSH